VRLAERFKDASPSRSACAKRRCRGCRSRCQIARSPSAIARALSLTSSEVNDARPTATVRRVRCWHWAAPRRRQSRANQRPRSRSSNGRRRSCARLAQAHEKIQTGAENQRCAEREDSEGRCWVFASSQPRRRPFHDEAAGGSRFPGARVWPSVAEKHHYYAYTPALWPATVAGAGAE